VLFHLGGVDDGEMVEFHRCQLTGMEVGNAVAVGKDLHRLRIDRDDR